MSCKDTMRDKYCVASNKHITLVLFPHMLVFSLRNLGVSIVWVERMCSVGANSVWSHDNADMKLQFSFSSPYPRVDISKY